MATPSASLTRPADPAKAVLRTRVASYVAASQDPSRATISPEQAGSVWGEMKGASGFYSLNGLVPEAQQAYEQGAQGLIQKYPKDPRLGDMLEEWRNHCFATFPAQAFQIDVLTEEDARAVKGTFDRVIAQDPNSVYSYHPNVQPDGSATVLIGTTLAHQAEFYAALVGAGRGLIEREQRAVLNAGQALAQMGQKLVTRDQALTAKEQTIAQQAAAREREVAKREQEVEQGKEYLKVFRVTSPTLVYYKEFPAYVQDTLTQEALAKGHTTDGKADVIAYLMTPEGRLKVSDVKNAMDKFREITPRPEMIGAFEARNERKPWYQTLVSDPTKAVQDLSEMIQIRGIMDAEQELSAVEKRVLDLRLGLTQGGTVYEKPLAQVAENLVQVRGQRGHSKRLWSVWGWNREALDFALDEANSLLTAEERIYAEAALRRPVWGGYGWRDNFDGQVPVGVANSVREGYRFGKDIVYYRKWFTGDATRIVRKQYREGLANKVTKYEPVEAVRETTTPNSSTAQPPAGGAAPTAPTAAPTPTPIQTPPPTAPVATTPAQPATPQTQAPTPTPTASVVTATPAVQTPAQPGRLRKTGRWMKANAKKISGASTAALGTVYGSSILEPVNEAMHNVYTSYPTILDADPRVKAIVAGTLAGVGALVYNMDKISNYFEGRRTRAAQAQAAPAQAAPVAAGPPQGPPADAQQQGSSAGPPQQEPPPAGPPQAQDGAQPPAGAQAPADAATPQGPPAGAPAQGQTQGTQ